MFRPLRPLRPDVVTGPRDSDPMASSVRSPPLMLWALVVLVLVDAADPSELLRVARSFPYSLAYMRMMRPAASPIRPLASYQWLSRAEADRDLVDLIDGLDEGRFLDKQQRDRRSSGPVFKRAYFGLFFISYQSERMANSTITMLLLTTTQPPFTNETIEIVGARIERDDGLYSTTMETDDYPARFVVFVEKGFPLPEWQFVLHPSDCPNGPHSVNAQVRLGKKEGHVELKAYLEPKPDPYLSCVRLRPTEDFEIIPDDEFKVLVQREDGLYMPLYVEVLFVVCLAMGSGFFSGINIATFSLSISHLKLLSNYGEGKMSQCARNILPLREKANLLLCTLVLGNTVVNNLLTLFTDSIINSLNFTTTTRYIVSFSITLGVIMVFGEMLPQAIGIKYCLRLVSFFRNVIIFFMVLFFPLAYPISKVLDWMVGETGRNTYNCEELKALVEYHHEKQQNEALNMKVVQMVMGAFRLPENKLNDVLTPIDKVYMLDEDTIMTKAVCEDINKKGHTRIPLYRGSRTMITSILNVKDLAAFKPDCGLKLGFIAKLFPRNMQLQFASEEMELMKLLKIMKRGHPMVFVFSFKPEKQDYEVIGIITVEDIVEEVIGEINDEKDARRQAEQRTQQQQQQKQQIMAVPSARCRKSIGNERRK